MPVPFLDLKAQYKSIKTEVDPVIQSVVETCAFALGPAVEKFEKDFAAYSGAKHCIGVGSGTAALELILRGLEVGPDDEVMTVANTFFATAEAISLVGAAPVLVDCRESDALIDTDKIEEAITDRTKAIIPVHLYGQCADMASINAIAEKYSLYVIEDACQAHGSGFRGKKAGALADAAAFSFYPGKNLGAYGEGGGITTDDDELAKQLRMLRNHGMPEKYKHSIVGSNERLDGIQGAVLDVKLKHLDQWNGGRRTNAALYRKLLSDVPGIILFETHDNSVHNYHLFVIRVKNRDEVQNKLKEKGISTGIHYPIPIHLQKAYEGVGWKKGDFPVAEKLAGEILSLPMFAELTEGQVREVSEAVAASI